LKWDRGNFNILTQEPEYSICVKGFNTNNISTNICSQVTVLKFTSQDGDDAQAMLLLLYAEDWDNNNRSALYSKCKPSI